MRGLETNDKSTLGSRAPIQPINFRAGKVSMSYYVILCSRAHRWHASPKSFIRWQRNVIWHMIDERTDYKYCPE
jgi:hypothetical protein